jgi:uncharacterized delta-60 repeat protein
LNGGVGPIVLQSDGKILIGGSFTTVGGIGRSRIARLNSDGTLDNSFTTDVFDNNVYCLALQPDGKMVVGGNFTSVGGIPRSRLARLDANGALDAGFSPSPNQYVGAVLVQPDGKILIGGYFTMIGSTIANYTARLNPDGSLDPGFIYSPAANAAAFALQTDGKILVGHAYGIYRVNPDGTRDSTFFESTSYYVYTMVIRPDGKVLVGGGFQSMGGQVRNRLALVLNTEEATQEVWVSANGGSVTWVRGATSPEVVRVVFEHSADQLNWENLGDGMRISGGWRITGCDLPLHQIHYVRARGYVVSGYRGGDGSLFDSIRMIYLVPNSPFFDHDGDGATDVAAYHIPSYQSFTSYAGNLGQYGWTGPSFMPLVWDRDGDGRTDVSAYQIDQNQWLVRNFPAPDGNMGQAGWNGEECVPVPGDYDGDGIMERAFYHWMSNRWFIEIQGSPGSFIGYEFGYGRSDAIPIVGDFDGDGIDDMLLYNVADNQWFMYGYGATNELGQFGWPNCIPVPGDWNGDGKMELGVYDTLTNAWAWREHSNSTVHFMGSFGWGGLDSFPIPGDYDGDGVYDLAVYRPIDPAGNNRWLINGIADFTWGYENESFIPLTSRMAVYNWYRFKLGMFQ